MDVLDGVVFVGRDRELADFDRRLAATQAGSGALVLVEGEAGAGKTALAYSLVGRARLAGVRVAWGACLEGEGAPAYRPWGQILRELGEPVSLLLNPAGGEAGSRFHVFDDVVEVLRNAARDRGLLLVVDDLHWADVPSMRLLQAVASTVAGSRLLVVGLYRGREAFPRGELADVLRTIVRERAALRITLGGLTPPEVVELATRTLGRRPDDALVRTVARRAEGNPLFVVELVRLVAASGSDAGLPDSVREVIGRRLDRLPVASRRLLRQAAVLGREFTTGVLSALVDQAPDGLLDLLEPAIAAELLHAGDGPTWRFAHVLIQEVLYGELPTAERQRLHAWAAGTLRAADAADSVDALAHHLRQAAPIGDAGEALRVTRQAATRARNQLAYEHAAFQYRAALGLLPLLPGGDALRAELLLDSARCEFRSGAVEDAWRSCRAAADLGRATGDAAVVADAAIVPRGITNSPMTAQIHAMSRDALTMLRGTDPVREAKVLAQLAITANPLASGGEPGLGQRALRAAEATGDADARFLAMQARHTELIDGGTCSNGSRSVSARSGSHARPAATSTPHGATPGA